MALEDLINIINKKGEEEANQIVGEANEKAAKILNAAEKLAESEKEKYLSDTIAKCRSKANQKISKAKLDSRNKILNFKKEIIGRVLNQSLNNLHNLDVKVYKAWLKRKILEGCELGNEKIIFCLDDKNILDDKWQKNINDSLKEKGFEGNLIFKFENVNFTGGFVMQHSDYEVVITFEDTIKEAEQKLLTKISEILFDDAQ